MCRCSEVLSTVGDLTEYSATQTIPTERLRFNPTPVVESSVYILNKGVKYRQRLLCFQKLCEIMEILSACVCQWTFML